MSEKSLQKLKSAKIFYKVSLGSSLNIQISKKKLPYYDQFTYYNHTVEGKDLELNKSQEELGALMLEHVGTYLMMVQLNKVLEDEYGESRLQNKKISNISQVVRLIRNAFAHDPFNPVWDISKSAQNKEFIIPGILTLQTHNLHNKKLERKDYNGPLALLKLVEFVERELE